MLLLVARDLALFYVGFEAMLVPLAFLIAVWGGPEPRARDDPLHHLHARRLAADAGRRDHARPARGDVRPRRHRHERLALAVPRVHGRVRDQVAALPVPRLGARRLSRVPARGRGACSPASSPRPAPTACCGSRSRSSRAPRTTCGAGSSRSRVVGLLWCSLMAFRQPDSRGVIAYSSIAQMSLIGLGIFVMNDIGATGATFQMVNHGLLSVLLFLIAGVVEVRTGDGLFRRSAASRAGRAGLVDDRHDDRHRGARGARLGALRLRVPRAAGRVPRLVADRGAGLARDRALGDVHAALDLGDPARHAARAVGRALRAMARPALGGRLPRAAHRLRARALGLSVRGHPPRRRLACTASSRP